MTHNLALLALDALAVFRLTRLVNADTVTARLRDRLAGSRPSTSMDRGGLRIMVAERPALIAFITCPWCVSPYIAVLVVAAQALIPAVWIYAAAVLAFSAIAGLLSEHA